MGLRDRLIVVALALAAFGLAAGGVFHLDDYSLFDRVSATTRPLTYASFALSMGHWVNVALHVAASLLVLAIARRDVAVFAAGLFAVHPLAAEPVNYLFERATLLAAVLALAAWRTWSAGRAWWAVAWFAAALAAKEEVVALPLFLVAIDGGEARRRWRPIAAMLALSVGFGLRVLMATRGVQGAGFGARISPWDYFVAQGAVIWNYLARFALGIGGTIDPDPWRPPVWAGLLMWAGLAVVAWRWRSLAGALILLLPSSSVFPADDLGADRRMYLPMAALAVAMAPWIARLPRVVTALVAGWFLFASIGRCRVWSTERSLWEEAVRESPLKVRPRIQLARALPAAEAITQLDAAKKLAPDDARVASEMGKTYLALGNPAAALAEFGRSLALSPGDARAWNNRGVALAALGQAGAARSDFKRALEIDPGFAEARENARKLE